MNHYFFMHLLSIPKKYCEFIVSKPIIIFFLKKYFDSFLPTTSLSFYYIVPANILNSKHEPGGESGANITVVKRQDNFLSSGR